MSAVGFSATAQEAFKATVVSTVDNIAINIDNSAEASQRGDSISAVLLGTVLGVLPSLATVFAGPALMATRLGPFLSESRLKKTAAAIFFINGTLKFRNGGGEDDEDASAPKKGHSVGFVRTALNSFFTTASSTLDNIATNTQLSTAAHARGDALGAVFLGAVSGVVPALVSVMAGPALLGSKLGEYLKDSQLRKLSGVLNYVLAATKIFDGKTINAAKAKRAAKAQATKTPPPPETERTAAARETPHGRSTVHA